jgi:hypothetical protein
MLKRRVRRCQAAVDLLARAATLAPGDADIAGGLAFARAQLPSQPPAVGRGDTSATAPGEPQTVDAPAVERGRGRPALSPATKARRAEEKAAAHAAGTTQLQ